MQKPSLNLKREYVRCALCGGDTTNVKYEINLQRIRLARVWMDGVEQRMQGTETLVVCKTCGLVYVNPRLVRVPGLSTYSVEEEMAYFNATREARRMAFKEMIHRLPIWLGRPARSLLDIGCGDGVLLQVARSSGIESMGTEISESLVRLVREQLGAQTIFSGNLDDLPKQGFDVVTLINVLEHVQDPKAILKIIARLLKPDGVLVVHTINQGGLPARLSGARWYQIEPFNHLYYFNDRTLRTLMLAVGLEPVSRFSLVISRGMKARVQRLLARSGIYLDNGLGMVVRPLPQ